MYKYQKVGNDIYGVKSNWGLESRLGETAETGFRHNDRYHRYFHGYTEVKTTKPNGGYSISRIYTSEWYVEDCSDTIWFLRKLVNILLCAIASILYLFFMTREGFAGSSSYIVSIPGFFSILLFILLDTSTVAYLFTKRQMTWWEWHSSSKRLTNYPLITGIMLFVTSVTVVINCFIEKAVIKNELLLAVGIMLCGLLVLLIYMFQIKTQYTTKENITELPEGEAHLIL